MTSKEHPSTERTAEIEFPGACAQAEPQSKSTSDAVTGRYIQEVKLQSEALKFKP